MKGRIKLCTPPTHDLNDKLGQMMSKAPQHLQPNLAPSLDGREALSSRLFLEAQMLRFAGESVFPNVDEAQLGL